jgi:hypothetical protein
MSAPVHVLVLRPSSSTSAARRGDRRRARRAARPGHEVRPVGPEPLEEDLRALRERCGRGEVRRARGGAGPRTGVQLAAELERVSPAAAHEAGAVPALSRGSRSGPTFSSSELRRPRGPGARAPGCARAPPCRRDVQGRRPRRGRAPAGPRVGRLAALWVRERHVGRDPRCPDRAISGLLAQLFLQLDEDIADVRVGTCDRRRHRIDRARPVERGGVAALVQDALGPAGAGSSRAARSLPLRRSCRTHVPGAAWLNPC